MFTSTQFGSESCFGGPLTEQFSGLRHCVHAMDRATEFKVKHSKKGKHTVRPYRAKDWNDHAQKALGQSFDHCRSGLGFHSEDHKPGPAQRAQDQSFPWVRDQQGNIFKGSVVTQEQTREALLQVLSGYRTAGTHCIAEQERNGKSQLQGPLVKLVSWYGMLGRLVEWGSCQMGPRPPTH